MHWSEKPLAALDFETTGIRPQEDRIVEAAFVIVGRDGKPLEGSFHTIVNPGIEIPEEAAKVHGITTERAQKEGVPPEKALKHLASLIEVNVYFNYPIVIYNAPFDWPLLSAEARRHGVDVPRDVKLVDPLCIDRFHDRYRKGGRTLEAVAAHYGVILENAHSAFADAVATAGVARALCAQYEAVRSPTLEELQILQRDWYEQWRDDMNAYFAKRGKNHRITGQWPMGDEAEVA